MSARESCKWCTRPIATDADYESIAEGEGRHLCWSEFGNDPDCDGVDGAEDIITDLRAQLAAVTAERDALKEALIGMCDQYLQVRNGKMHHDFMSAGEAAFEALGWPDDGQPVDESALCDVPGCGNSWSEGTPGADGVYHRRCFRHSLYRPPATDETKGTT